MIPKDIFGASELLKKEGPDLLRAFIRSHRGAVQADLRFETMFRRSSSATDGEARSAHEGESAESLIVRALPVAGRPGSRSAASHYVRPRSSPLSAPVWPKPMSVHG
jgi:hypothetical protein